MSPPSFPVIVAVWVFLTQKHCRNESTMQKSCLSEPSLLLTWTHLKASALELSAKRTKSVFCMVDIRCGKVRDE